MFDRALENLSGALSRRINIHHDSVSKRNRRDLRIWSLHPKYLDPVGLVALWREGLLAQAVIEGKTKGYSRHPQLIRFKEQLSPLGSIAEYLRAVHCEAVKRRYHFNARKISRSPATGRLEVTRGQLAFEWSHLMAKLRARNPSWWSSLTKVKQPQQHPLFRVKRGQIAQWEKGIPPNKAFTRPPAKPTTIAEYIDAAPEQARKHLREMYAILRKVAPGAAETLKWGSPAFEEKRILFAFAAFKSHLNFMPTPAAMAPFKKELAKYGTGKGTIRFPYDKPLPKVLIGKIAALRAKELREKDARWM